MNNESKGHVIHNPHDKAFLDAMSNKEVARDAMRAYLPKKLLKQADLENIRPYHARFITPYLREFQVDVIYQIPLQKEKSAFFFLHCEHQSSVEKKMPLRMWLYIFLLLNEYYDNNPTKPLPIVYPLIIYTGDKAYTASTDLFDLFGKDKKTAKAYLLAPIKLIDVCRLDDETIEEHELFGLSELIFKYKKSKQVEEVLERFIKDCEKLAFKMPPGHAKMLLTYLVNTYKHSNADTLSRVAKKHETESLGEDIMTAAQEWKQEGRLAEKHEMIVNLSRLNVSLETIAQASNYSVAKIEQVKKELD